MNRMTRVISPAQKTGGASDSSSCHASAKKLPFLQFNNRCWNIYIHFCSSSLSESLGVWHTLLYNIFWLIRIRCSSITNVSIIAHHDPVQTSIGFHLIPFEQFALLGGLARLTPRSLTEQSHLSWASLRAKSMLIAPVLKRIPLFISHCFPVLFLTRGSFQFAVIQVNREFSTRKQSWRSLWRWHQTDIDSVQVYTLFLSSLKCCCQQPVGH